MQSQPHSHTATALDEGHNTPSGRNERSNGSNGISRVIHEVRKTNTEMSFKTTLRLSAILITAWMPEIDAAVVVVAPTRTEVGSIQITQNVTFDIFQNGTVGILVLNDWITADQAKTPSIVSPFISISLNGGASKQYSAEFYDNLASSFAGLTQGDGYFAITSGPSVSAGDSITFNAGTFTLSTARNFNPLATQTFNGEVFLINHSGVQLSNLVALPEPATSAFCLLGFVAFTLRRR